MHITPQGQPTLESISRLTASAVAAFRTLLGFAQAADWNGRTLTAMLFSTLLFRMFGPRFDDLETSLLRPAALKIKIIIIAAVSLRRSSNPCDTYETVLNGGPLQSPLA